LFSLVSDLEARLCIRQEEMFVSSHISLLM
jgi:hypothetical protein